MIIMDYFIFTIIKRHTKKMRSQRIYHQQFADHIFPQKAIYLMIFLIALRLSFVYFDQFNIAENFQILTVDRYFYCIYSIEMANKRFIAELILIVVALQLGNSVSIPLTATVTSHVFSPTPPDATSPDEILIPVGLIDKDTNIQFYASLIGRSYANNPKDNLGSNVKAYLQYNGNKNAITFPGCLAAGAAQAQYQSSCISSLTPTAIGSTPVASSVVLYPTSAMVPNIDVNPPADSLLIYSITILVNGSKYTQVTGIMRVIFTRLIYLNSTQASYVITVTGSSAITQNNLRLIPVTSMTGEYPTGSQLRVSPTTTGGTVKTYTFTHVTAGYYRFQYGGDPVKVTIAYSTDPYPCPYDPRYIDQDNNFAGCFPIFPTVNATPCVQYDSAKLVCTKCMDGYTLSYSGFCYQNQFNCPPRQYYHYNSCLDVSPLCGNYDSTNGNCLTCANPTYFVRSGICIQKTCLPNQLLLNNGLCFTIPNSCSTIDPNTGACLFCNTGFTLNPPYCLPNPIVCLQNQYISNGVCVNIDPNCAVFNRAAVSCQKCALGYYLQNGVCMKVNCEPGTYPTSYGLFCAKVSPLCVDYNSLTGACLSCIKGYLLQNDGTCSQLSSPAGVLAGCLARQQLGFGQCIGAEVNCANYNLNTGNCDQCNSGYSYDYKGLCTIVTSAMTQCGSNQYFVNGFCYTVSPLCATFNPRNGFCLTCVNGGKPVGGQCSNQASVSCSLPNQYTDQNGFCQSVSPRCATFNPTNGFCLTCQTPSDTLNNGVCCPWGTVNINGVCQTITVGPNPSQMPASPNDPNCSHYHPSLGYCVSCFRGFILSSPMYGQCISK